ncbi:hypothetical protein TNCV_2471941 [Trichonephila clavipes]|nr:hypothetical protein TNCV_2471941 [Trichonephila clavipes]
MKPVRCRRNKSKVKSCYSISKQCVVVRFLNASELDTGIYQRMGQSIASTSNNWIKNFRKGRQLISDLDDSASSKVPRENPDNIKKMLLKSVGTRVLQSGFVSLKPTTLFPLRRAVFFLMGDEGKEAMWDFLENKP